MITMYLCLAAIAGTVAAWSLNWPDVEGWGRAGARDRIRGGDRGDMKIVGVELPRSCENAQETMQHVLDRVVEAHSIFDPASIALAHEGLGRSQAELHVVLMASSTTLPALKQRLTDAFEGNVTFYVLPQKLLDLYEIYQASAEDAGAVAVNTDDAGDEVTAGEGSGDRDAAGASEPANG
jgi:hypothetical protein